MPDCLTCERIASRDDGAAPSWDAIARTAGWDLAHAFDTAVEGWLVLVARRHVSSIADLTDSEAVELGPLVRDVSAILQDVVGVSKTYVVQFAEHPQHPHVHVHLIPRSSDLPEAYRGPRVFQLLGVSEEERVSERRMTEIADMVARRLSQSTHR